MQGSSRVQGTCTCTSYTSHHYGSPSQHCTQALCGSLGARLGSAMWDDGNGSCLMQESTAAVTSDLESQLTSRDNQITSLQAELSSLKVQYMYM